MTYSLYPIPKIIHFIWAGGDRAFPMDNANVKESNHHIVHEWIKDNPEFYTLLWVDKEELPACVFDEYLHRGYIWIESIEDLWCGKKQTAVNRNSIYLVDIQTAFDKAPHFLPQKELDFIKNIIFYEMRWRFHPNYGASSDLLRYLILLLYGGVYFDSDVHPGIKKLSEHPCFQGALQSPFFVRHTNDAFICTPGHAYWLDILNQCMNNYRNSTITLENHFNYHWNTYYRTGPGVHPVKWFHHHLLPSCFYDQPDGSGHKNWAKITTTAESVYEKCIKKAANSLLFENKYMNVLRLDHYVNDVSLSLRESVFKPIRSLIRLGLAHSIWGKWIQQLRAQYWRKKYDRREGVLQKIRRNRHKNYSSFCRDIRSFLETHGVNEQIIGRVINTIDLRAPIMTAKLVTHFKHLQQEILNALGASFDSCEPGIGGLAISDILLEENLLELLLPLSLDNLGCKERHEYESAYLELINSCNRLVSSLHASNSDALSELKPVLNADLFNHQELLNVLKILNTDTNSLFKSEIKEQLVLLMP